MNKPKMPSLVTVLMLTLITVVSWTVFGVLRLILTKPSIKVEASVLEPVIPTFDEGALDKVTQRVFFSAGEITQTLVATPSAISVVTTPTPSPSPVATSSASPSPRP